MVDQVLQKEYDDKVRGFFDEALGFKVDEKI